LGFGHCNRNLPSPLLENIPFALASSLQQTPTGYLPQRPHIQTRMFDLHVPPLSPVDDAGSDSSLTDSGSSWQWLRVGAPSAPAWQIEANGVSAYRNLDHHQKPSIFKPLPPFINEHLPDNYSIGTPLHISLIIVVPECLNEMRGKNICISRESLRSDLFEDSLLRK